MNFTFGLPVFFISRMLTWYGVSSLIRLFQTSFASPIDTQTSVCTKSTPLTPLSMSSVMVMRAPVSAARLAAISRTSSCGWFSFGATMRTSQPMIAAEHQQRVAHVVAGVAQEGVGDLGARLVGMLHHGQHVGQHLRRMPVVGQAVVDRNAGVSGKLLDHLLAGAAELDGVEHAPEHSGRVLHRLLVADLRAAWIEIGDMRALVMGGDLERAAGARRRFLENQADVLVLQRLLLGAGVFGALEVARQIEQVEHLALSEVRNLEVAATLEIESHDGSSLRLVFFCRTAAGQ